MNNSEYPGDTNRISEQLKYLIDTPCTLSIFWYTQSMSEKYKTCITFPSDYLSVVKAVQTRYGLPTFTAAVLFIIKEFWVLKEGKL